MYKIIITLVFILIFHTSAFSNIKDKKMLKATTYNSKNGNKVYARTVTLKGLKKAYSKDITKYIQSSFKQFDFKNNNEAKAKLDNILLLTTKNIKILQEKWDGQTYYIKAVSILYAKDVYDQLNSIKISNKQIESNNTNKKLRVVLLPFSIDTNKEMGLACHRRYINIIKKTIRKNKLNLISTYCSKDKSKVEFPTIESEDIFWKSDGIFSDTKPNVKKIIKTLKKLKNIDLAITFKATNNRRKITHFQGYIINLKTKKVLQTKYIMTDDGEIIEGISSIIKRIVK